MYVDSTLFGKPAVVSEDGESMQMIDIMETRNPADLRVMAEALDVCNRTGLTPEDAEMYIRDLEQRNRHLYDEVNGLLERLREAYSELEKHQED